MTYEAYTVTIKTDSSYWTEFDPDCGPDDIEFRLRERFPGIQIRKCPLACFHPDDNTLGPDPDIICEIDGAYDWVLNVL